MPLKVEQPGSDELEMAGQRMGKLRVLVVDDEALIRRALSRALRPHLVREAATRNQAESLLRAEPFDLVISDYCLVEESGVVVLQMAAKLQPMARRVMLSGSFPDDLIDWLDCGLVEQFVSKPWLRSTIDEIVSVVAQAVGRGRANESDRE